MSSHWKHSINEMIFSIHKKTPQNSRKSYSYNPKSLRPFFLCSELVSVGDGKLSAGDGATGLATARTIAALWIENSVFCVWPFLWVDFPTWNYIFLSITIFVVSCLTRWVLKYLMKVSLKWWNHECTWASVLSYFLSCLQNARVWTLASNPFPVKVVA